MTKASEASDSQKKSMKKGLPELILEWGPHSPEQPIIDALNKFDDGLASALDLDRYPQNLKASSDSAIYTPFHVADFFPSVRS